ncbi:glutamine--fructose-6-phosphate aminotransferase [Megasphaera cerevisiae DSM 20462]|jgi:glucosamine--fructose-6-phosphate aminotransferase (isomerizing)|uniref:Glutamine--fructose-6-phosphate aminotransferase [isomerizing] n=1 Tax=Megasphaera cerevisiae DSM 20462 TaxID=1122219 RepID=A0A0J6WVA1_9FIRM|nr:glutamine--fructose-6-phosphate transaminase (isomerizing) [Megasphaera cerevisiae]KMO86118.1 glutamine--fructose-6-phosphate aminotransferase [Megasphaera cerevisiae DSM 20462]OKY52371.1 glutamine--fructose-6-phosphate aminotransferase [Megasphaera cerevisiae]SKA04719.1 glucosamine--fructose-6-phosphate aminotransferase (isomerizing) [Megasphaera cerevisiae DSM 20462]
MCGIVGYIGDREAADFLMDGLSKLEYRGYDSAGIAVYHNGAIAIRKKAGRLVNLSNEVKAHPIVGTAGIGHTRWATHGGPSDVNAHPHTDEKGNFAIVHNGIIENYMEIKEHLLAKGYHFKSETDTEVVAHLCADMYDGDFTSTVRRVLAKLQGSYSLVFMCKFEPDKIICSKKDNPLIVGLGNGENYIASDIPAILNYTRKTYIMNDGEIAIVQKDKVWVIDFDGRPISKKIFEVNWDAEAAEKGGFEHFMLKEIYEQPKVIKDTMSCRIASDGEQIQFEELNWTPEDVKSIGKIMIVACGTAYHAGLLAKYFIEKLARIPVEVDIASEYRYRDPLTDSKTLCIVISQSGETIDTLAALKEAKRRGARSLAITNVVGSSVSREADQVVYTWAGPEIAVASTKAYTTQLVALLLLALYMGRLNGHLTADREAQVIRDLQRVPDQCRNIFDHAGDIKELAAKIKEKEDIFFIGRSMDYGLAMEGALKLKEISYIHAEAYAGGELKHGTLALIISGVPVIALATQQDVEEKMISNIKEVKARDAYVIGVVQEGDTEVRKTIDSVITIPRSDNFVLPIMTVIPLQLLAYYTAVVRGNDVDKPRNLAKSVTVE